MIAPLIVGWLLTSIALAVVSLLAASVQLERFVDAVRCELVVT